MTNTSLSFVMAKNGSLTDIRKKARNWVRDDHSRESGACPMIKDAGERPRPDSGADLILSVRSFRMGAGCRPVHLLSV
jgi:hypothetical protein